jgi:hypothetical protein
MGSKRDFFDIADNRQEQLKLAQAKHREKLKAEGKRQLMLIVSDKRREAMTKLVKLIEEKDIENFGVVVATDGINPKTLQKIPKYIFACIDNFYKIL